MIAIMLDFERSVVLFWNNDFVITSKKVVKHLPRKKQYFYVCINRCLNI